MSRSGYSDDYGYDEPGLLQLYRANVDRALRGRRGQAFLRDLAAALDAMPHKRLLANAVEKDGDACSLGAVGRARGIDLWDGIREQALGAARHWAKYGRFGLLDGERHTPREPTEAEVAQALEDVLDEGGFPDEAAPKLGIARCVAAEVVYVNDEGGRYGHNETPEERWRRVRAWVTAHLEVTNP